MTPIRQTIAVLAAGLALAGCGGDGGGGPKKPPAPEKVLQHYLCYDVRETGFARPRGVEVVDQFDVDPKVAIVEHAKVCNPVTKNGSAPPTSSAHLVCYTIQGDEPTASVRISNQFDRQRGNQDFGIGEAVEICVPSGKTADPRPPRPPPIPADLDHFKCYAPARRAKVESVPADLRDQFVPKGGGVAILSLRMLCSPADKSVDGVPKSKRKNPGAHLACYALTGFGQFEGRKVLIANQLEERRELNAVFADVLCVPSKKAVLK